MAGSYEHILNGWSMIEYMGDAQEAVEELMWLVQSQIGEEDAKRLLNGWYYPMVRGEEPEDPTFIEVKRLMEE